MKYLLLGIGILLGLLIIILLIRTWLFVDKTNYNRNIKIDEELDDTRVLQLLCYKVEKM